MSTTVKSLIDSFNALSEAEKHEAAIEIMKLVGDTGDVPESTLCEIADELFQTMDQNESEDAKP